MNCCKEMEKILRDRRKPGQWSIVNWKGRIYLHRNPRVEKVEAIEDEWDDVKLSQECLSNQSEELTKAKADDWDDWDDNVVHGVVRRQPQQWPC